MTKNNNHFAEVIESSLIGWLAQSWKWDNFPSFGSLVMTETKDQEIFGIVHQVQTGSMDPTRSPFPYQKTEEELLREQPQIFEFLKTTFSCLTVGYIEKNSISYLLASKPPKIHSFVTISPPQLTKQFFSNEKYLHLLFNLSQQIFNIDELILALLKQQKKLNILTDDKLKIFIHTYSLLTGNDYHRIKLFLQRVEHGILL
ncbi:MAG: hypothetical protein WCD44_00795 [Candidatus Babeliales bacterium]